MKAIMYHYIREYNPALPNFTFLHVDDFKKQLDYFQEQFYLPTQKEFIASVKNHQPMDNAVILTFDDGLKDHYTYVLPELKKRGLFGIFYVPTMPYTQQKLLNVHRIHMLLGAFPASSVLHTLGNLLRQEMISDAYQNKFSNKLYRNQKNSTDAQRVKELLNYYIDNRYRDELLELLMLHYFPDEAKLAESFYMTKQELQTMQDEGMLVGSHAVSHSVMSKLSMHEQQKEIRDSFSFLNAHVKNRTLKTFCYPYGGFHTFSQETEDLLTQEDVAFSFNVESRDISKNDLQNRPQALPRYDCNEFEHGQIYKQGNK